MGINTDLTTFRHHAYIPCTILGKGDELRRYRKDNFRTVFTKRRNEPTKLDEITVTLLMIDQKAF